MAIDLNSLEYQSRRVAGDKPNNQKATYGVEFASGGQNYTFIPTSVMETGVKAGDTNYVLPWFLDKGNLAELGKQGQYVDLAGKSWYGDYLKDTVGASTTGFLVPSGSLPFDSKMSKASGNVKGVGTTKEGLSYILDKPAGKLGQYIASDGKLTTLSQTEGRSLLGKTLGSWYDDFTKSTGTQKVAGEVNDFFQTDLGKAVKVAALVASAGGSGMFDTAAQTTTEAAATEAAAAEASAQAASQAAASQAGQGLLSNAALDAQFIAADAAQLSAQGLSSAQIASTLQASGVDAFIAADAAQLAAQGLSAGQITSTIQQGMPTATGATGAGGLFTGARGGTTYNATGAASGATSAAAASNAASQAGGALSTAQLIQGGLGLAGGLLQGNTSQNALRDYSAQQAALAQKTLEMGKFQPVGMTSRFGSSSFTTDPVTGAITPSYTLSPEALAYQNSLSGLATQGLQGGQSMMNLGQQYVGESPDAVRQRYMSTQNALLAPGNEQALANLRNNLVQTGRSGLATGATSAGGMGATNPELAAYYNSLAQQQNQLAAGAETQYQNQVNFGAGLMGGAATPFNNVFNAQKGVETAAQDPLKMSTDFANTVATRGAAQGANYASAMNPSLQAQQQANSYNPWATVLQGAASNPAFAQGAASIWN